MAEKYMDKCECPVCLKDETYWKAFENVIQAVAALLTICIDNQHVDSFNWLLIHFEGMFQAAGQALNDEAESRVVH